MQKSIERSHIAARNVRPLVMSQQEVQSLTMTALDQLDRLGITFPPRLVQEMISGLGMDGTGMDSQQAGLTTASIGTPIQFLQTWLPGFVNTITAARMIDELTGITTVGSWEDEEVVQGVLEPIGNAVPYGDYTNVPLASWNTNFERRSVVRFEKGLLVGKLEEARASRMKVSSANEKRGAVMLSLEIQRNLVGFNGYNSGANRTYGFLNDPSLPAYVNVATGASSSTLWSSKTFLEITADIRTAFAALQVQAQGNIRTDSQLTLAVALASAAYLSVTNVQGTQSVRQWIEGTYKGMRIVEVPQLSAANGGANVFYLYAESIQDMVSSDNSRVFDQIVPAKFQALGVENRAKGYLEDYTNATAGILLKRPYGVVRYSGT